MVKYHVRKQYHPLDRIYIGLLIGIVVPLIAFLIYYLLKFSSVNFITYIQSLHEYRILFKIMSLCVLADLAVFYLFIQFKFWRTSRGMVMACFIYAFAVMCYRLFV